MLCQGKIIIIRFCSWKKLIVCYFRCERFKMPPRRKKVFIIYALTESKIFLRYCNNKLKHISHLRRLKCTPWTLHSFSQNVNEVRTKDFTVFFFFFFFPMLLFRLVAFRRRKNNYKWLLCMAFAHRLFENFVFGCDIKICIDLIGTIRVYEMF